MAGEGLTAQLHQEALHMCRKRYIKILVKTLQNIRGKNCTKENMQIPNKHVKLCLLTVF